MIRSMTAFATCERAVAGGQLACELRAVNHRFLELAVRAPEELRVFEPLLVLPFHRVELLLGKALSAVAIGSLTMVVAGLSQEQHAAFDQDREHG